MKSSSGTYIYIDISVRLFLLLIHTVEYSTALVVHNICNQ
jgi:hypothetical protein